MQRSYACYLLFAGPDALPSAAAAVAAAADAVQVRHAWQQRSAQFQAKLLFRLLASVPPVVGAWFVSDLGKILDYTGECESPLLLFLLCGHPLPIGDSSFVWCCYT